MKPILWVEIQAILLYFTTLQFLVNTHLFFVFPYQKKNCYLFRIVDGSLNGKKSKNGLYINKQKSSAHDLKHGDLIEFGVEVRAKYYSLSNLSDSEFLEFCEVEDVSGFLVRPGSPFDTLIAPQDSSASSSDAVLTRLASFPELIPNPIVELDSAGKVTYLNPAAIAQFPKLQQLGKKHPFLTKLFLLVQKQKTSFVQEIKIDNKVFEQAAHYFAESDLIRIFITDITERKQAEAEKEQRDRLLQRVIAAQDLSFEQRLKNLLDLGCQCFDLEIGIFGKIDGNFLKIEGVQKTDSANKLLVEGKILNIKEANFKPLRQTIANSNPISYQNLEDFPSGEPDIEISSSTQRAFLIEAYLGMRVMVKSHIYGILCFFSSRPHQNHFSEADRKLLKLMTQWLGSEIERRKTNFNLEQQLRQTNISRNPSKSGYAKNCPNHSRASRTSFWRESLYYSQLSRRTASQNSLCC